MVYVSIGNVEAPTHMEQSNYYYSYYIRQKYSKSIRSIVRMGSSIVYICISWLFQPRDECGGGAVGPLLHRGQGPGPGLGLRRVAGLPQQQQGGPAWEE